MLRLSLSLLLCCGSQAFVVTLSGSARPQYITTFASPALKLPSRSQRAALPVAAAEIAAPSPPPPSSIISPLAQFSLLLGAYWLHISWLSETFFHLRLFKWRIEVPGENAIGVLVVGACAWAIRRGGRAERARKTIVERAQRQLPWGEVTTNRLLLIQTTATLLACYLFSGYVGHAVEFGLDSLVALGVPGLTVSRHRAIHVLLTHLAWVGMAIRVLGVRLRPFFPPPFGQGKWVRARFKQPSWLLWALGGYFASLLTYNAVECANIAILPPIPEGSLLLEKESVVAKLVSPEAGDLLALGIGSIGPCLTAPLFEELLYRGFLLPALCRFLPLNLALILHALLFGLHHHALPALLPLSALGLLWGLLYVASGNLVVSACVHALWNGRIFLTSLLEMAAPV